MRQSSKEFPAFVSTQWLDGHRADSALIILDIRPEEEYTEGHVPGAIGSFFGLWIVEGGGYKMRLPSDDYLLRQIDSCGITQESKVVIYSRADNDYNRADATRVGWTLSLSGVAQVAILDGGYRKWADEGREVSTQMVTPKSTAYSAVIDRSAVASRAFVKEHIGKTTIIDNRGAKVYFGAAIELFAPRPGHIPGAVNLPTPWIYTEEGTLIDTGELEAMAINAAGPDKTKDIIVYCGAGGFGSTWWFLLTKMFGYQKVRLYDGAAQDWVRDPDAPLELFKWC
jgi:thiosulfate/3-mercaptopyruvate sulfurtransferase